MSWWWEKKVPTDFSLPSPKNGYYDVFLSFRGEDTRYGFTANLYRVLQENKIHTFMDVKLTGQNIDNLFEMIGKSRVAVVIYSENFASSSWCLREMEMILQQRKEKKMLMVPIFYKVDVHELKHLSGKTGKYLDKHVSKHDECAVNKWKYAVTSFANVSGLSYKDTQSRYEYDFIVDVVATVKEKLGECCKDIILAKIEKGSASQSHQYIEVYPQLRQEDRASSTQSFKHTNTATEEEEVYHIVTSASFQILDGDEGELLNIKPMFTLNFHVEKGKPSSSCLILTNKTDDYVAFMIQVYQPLKYGVNPNKGLLLPRSTCQVKVTMEAEVVFDAQDMNGRDDIFDIQSLKAMNNSYSMDDFSYAFKRESENTIYKHKICVRHSTPPYLSSSEKDHDAQLADKGFVQHTNEVISVEIHPTKPWLLLGLVDTRVYIWNYETQAKEKSFLVSDSHYKKYPKFIHEKPWIVVGTRNGFVCVFDYNTLEKVKEFKAHEGSTLCVAVHPTLPYLLTTSSDKLIKVWNWENGWTCGQMFEGNSNDVTAVAFNPKDSRSFASVSKDGIIKIWSFDSSVAEFTMKENGIPYCSVEYFIGNDNKLYLLCSSGFFARVWDYESKTCIQTLEGHSNDVTTTLVHSKLSVIITSSEDKTICIWNKNMHRLEHVWNCDLGRIFCMRYIKASNEIVLGCQDGVVMIKIVNAKTRSY